MSIAKHCGNEGAEQHGEAVRVEVIGTLSVRWNERFNVYQGTFECEMPFGNTTAAFDANPLRALERVMLGVSSQLSSSPRSPQFSQWGEHQKTEGWLTQLRKM